jgi:hypothetical protein
MLSGQQRQYCPIGLAVDVQHTAEASEIPEVGLSNVNDREMPGIKIRAAAYK